MQGALPCGTFPHTPRLEPYLRLSPHTAQHLRSISMAIHEASVPISPAPRYILRVQLAPSLGTFGSVFPKAKDLRLQSSSWCMRLSRTLTTTSFPPLLKDIGFSESVGPSPTFHQPWHSLGSFPCSASKTQTKCFRWRVSHCPFRSLRLPSVDTG